MRQKLNLKTFLDALREPFQSGLGHAHRSSVARMFDKAVRSHQAGQLELLQACHFV